MERLKPILEQRFWILLGVAIIMTLTGWWLATASMAKEITTRSAEIEKAFSSIPKGKIPNDNWAKSLADINKEQERSITMTRASLWKGQLKKLLEWPDGVKPKNGYQGTFSKESKEEYREVAYVDEVTKVWKTLRPLEPDGSGIVNYPLDNMYAVLRREPDWKGTTIADTEMWDIKEDLLLMESLFQSIAAVNGGPDVARSVEMVHQIDVLELRGGGAKAKPAPPSLASASMGGMASFGEMETYSADFNPLEEFGDDGNAPLPRLSEGGGGGRGRAVIDDGPTMGPIANRKAARQQVRTLDKEEMAALEKYNKRAGLSAPTGGSASGNKGKPIERYITKVDNAYRTRGFYLLVKMDHQRIPQLIAELTSHERSVWPVEIIRVQMSRLHEDATTVAAGPAVPAMAGGRRRPPEDDGPINNPPPGRGVGGVNTDGPDQVVVAKASLEKALANPTIAQVAICGVFTLYQEVKEDPTTSAPAANPAIAASQVKVPAAQDIEVKEDGAVPSDDSNTSSDSATTTDASGETIAKTAEVMTDAPNGTDEQPAEPDDGKSNPDSQPAKKENEEQKENEDK